MTISGKYQALLTALKSLEPFIDKLEEGERITGDEVAPVITELEDGTRELCECFYDNPYIHWE